MSEQLTGWGGNKVAAARVHELPEAGVPASVVAAIRAAGTRAVLARGAGRAYGDAALNNGGDVLRIRGGPIGLDPSTGVLRVGAGVTVGEILHRCVPAGWLPPALPGTRQVTVGGVVAADVHGKDQRARGAVGVHLLELTLVDGLGNLRTTGPHNDPDAFWATVGGMGLTGIVTEVRMQLLPIATSALRVRTERCADLDAVLAAMQAPAAERYCVAWLDALSSSPWAGRGVVEWAEHADPEDLPSPRRIDPLAYRVPRAPAVPLLPWRVVSAPLVRGYNALKLARTPVRRQRIAELSPYFHQLDALRDWNRLYGPSGLCQYHVLVPAGAAHLLRRLIERLRAQGIPPLLAVLKRHGPGDPAPLSFPRDGWGLALDLPAGHPKVAGVLSAFDAELAAAGGRVYLAKDSMLRPDVFAAMYPRLSAWQQVRDRLDPELRLRSDLGVRLGLCR